ncbi:MAG: hypothetical protein WCB01_05730 [Candidatus Cybelea sp.]
MRRVLFWTIIAALATLLAFLAVPFLEGIPIVLLAAIEMPWQPLGVFAGLLALAISVAPVVAVWLVFRKRKVAG